LIKFCALGCIGGTSADDYCTEEAAAEAAKRDDAPEEAAKRDVAVAWEA
jgi:hypothetical protein